MMLPLIIQAQVLALQAVVDSGKKVDGKEIIYLTEMLMRELLKLDGIEAEGEGRVQRKMEVRILSSSCLPLFLWLIPSKKEKSKSFVF